MAATGCCISSFTCASETVVPFIYCLGFFGCLLFRAEFRQKNAGRKSGSSKAKDTNKKAKKNEQSTDNGDGSKHQEDDNNDDANGAE